MPKPKPKRPIFLRCMTFKKWPGNITSDALTLLGERGSMFPAYLAKRIQITLTEAKFAFLLLTEWGDVTCRADGRYILTDIGQETMSYRE